MPTSPAPLAPTHAPTAVRLPPLPRVVAGVLGVAFVVASILFITHDVRSRAAAETRAVPVVAVITDPTGCYRGACSYHLSYEYAEQRYELLHTTRDTPDPLEAGHELILEIDPQTARPVPDALRTSQGVGGILIGLLFLLGAAFGLREIGFRRA